MPVDVKKTIAQAAHTLMTTKGVRKLTVKDIVEECGITRQTFYYHFSDIPDLVRWMLEQETEQFVREIRNAGEQAAVSGETRARREKAGLRYFFLMAVNATPHIKKSMQSSYGAEIERLLETQMQKLLGIIADESGFHRNLGRFERELTLRYHSQAILCMLKNWSDEDSAHLDEIIRVVHRLLTQSAGGNDGD